LQDPSVPLSSRFTLPPHLSEALPFSDTPGDLGVLYGIGVGPGDPELLTIKSLRYLQAASVVAFPAGLNDQPGVAERIIAPWLLDTQTRLPLTFPYVLDAQELSTAWHQAAQVVWPYLEAGRNVVFACEGDVSFYGTFTYLAQSLQLQHPKLKVSAIPGVSSPMAAAAALGIPLTCQGQRLAILPALYAIDELVSAISWADVVVLMKVSSVYRKVWEVLADQGLLARSYIVEKATRTDQKTYVGLENHPDIVLPYFSLLIIQCGEVVSVL